MVDEKVIKEVAAEIVRRVGVVRLAFGADAPSAAISDAQLAAAHVAVLMLAPGAQTALMRRTKAAYDTAVQKVFDDAVAAEAKRLNRALAVSEKFVDTVAPGLEEQGFKAGREKILSSVRRLKLARSRKSTGS